MIAEKTKTLKMFAPSWSEPEEKYPFNQMSEVIVKVKV